MRHQEKPITGNILIVDDTPENLRLLVNLLREQKYNVWPAPNGVRALATLQKHRIDLILLDIIMPDMDGYAICERIKTEERTREIPVIFLSALDEVFDKVKAFSLGGVDYITKPFEVEEVLARIRTHLTLRKQQQELQEQQQRFHILADATFEGILIHDHNEILEVNQTLADMFGYESTALIGQNTFELIEPESRDTLALHLNNSAEDPYEVQAIKQDGTVFPVELRARDITWQSRALKVVTVRDMSLQHVLAQEERTFRIALEGREHFGRLIGKSPAMKKVYESILRAAATDAPVVIYGETGTGKELTARTIFDMSEQHTTCFVPVNCASIPENLCESQFFGHRKGAFTGADRDYAGYFEQAQGGTLFLDEVGELSLTMQGKLLRVLEDHTYTPVGANASRIADVRILAATNKELRTLARQGKIRSDFFHRLHVLAIDLPPLRWHKEDIPLLIAHFLHQHTDAWTPPPTIPPTILERFDGYEWPGNVRELFNELRRYLTTGEVELADSLPTESAGEKNGTGIQDDLPLSEAIERFEHYYIPRTLHRHGGHKGNTADILGIDRKTLYRKLKKYGLLP